MTRTMIGVLLALGPAMISPAIGQEPVVSKPKEQNLATHVDQRQAKPEFKVVFWYRRADPSPTLKHQAYDLRRGEYDRAVVERWLKQTNTEFPAYAAIERDINLDSVPGATDEAKLAAAIQRERDRIIGAHARQVEHHPVPPGSPSQSAGHREASRSPSAYVPTDVARYLHPGGSYSSRGGYGSGVFHGPPGSGGSSMFPSSTPFPQPYPYPRPHP